MKLSKQAARAIQEAIAALDVGIAFVQSPKTHIIRETSTYAGLSYSWKNGEGKEGVDIEKQIGSDLTGFYRARKHLKELITPVEQETT